MGHRGQLVSPPRSLVGSSRKKTRLFSISPSGNCEGCELATLATATTESRNRSRTTSYLRSRLDTTRSRPFAGYRSSIGSVEQTTAIHGPDVAMWNPTQSDTGRLCSRHSIWMMMSGNGPARDSGPILAAGSAVLRPGPSCGLSMGIENGTLLGIENGTPRPGPRGRSGASPSAAMESRYGQAAELGPSVTSRG